MDFKTFFKSLNETNFQRIAKERKYLVKIKKH